MPSFAAMLTSLSRRAVKVATASLLTAGAHTAATAADEPIPGIVLSGPSSGPVLRPTLPGGAPQGAPTPLPGSVMAPPPAQTQKPKPAVVKKPKPKAAPAAAASAGSGPGAQNIVALVNDEPISAFDVDQRVSFLILSSPEIGQRIQAKFKAPDLNERFKSFVMARNPKSQAEVDALRKQFAESLASQARSEMKPTLRKSAMEELIEERLKLQEAKKLSITVTDEDVGRVIKNIAERNKLTEKQFADNIKSKGSDIAVMRQRFKAALAWREVVRRKFGPLISINDREIDQIVSTKGAAGEQTRLQLQRITLPLAGQVDQRAMAQRFEEAEGLRRKFSSCATVASLAKGTAGARHESLGAKSAMDFPEPTRSILLNAKDGEMVPPSLAAGGIELYAVCGRQSVASKESEEKRSEVQADLQQKELEVMGRRFLKDIRQDALIEYR